MQAYDFSSWKCHSSSLGILCSDPKDTASKKNGDLSESAKKHLVDVYVSQKYDRHEEWSNKYVEKGTAVEQKGIDLLSFHDDLIYTKNEDRLENDWFTGLLDIFVGPKITLATQVWDMKCPYSFNTFLENLVKPLNPYYIKQVNSYFSLVGEQCKSGGICYCLVDAPEYMIKDELYKLLRKMNVASDESPEFIEPAAKLEYSMVFGDVPLGERILKFPIRRDDELIELMKRKVEKGRDYLDYFQNKHLNHNLPSVLSLMS